MSKNVPINKGNYDMDTEERLKQFEAKRGLGWETVCGSISIIGRYRAFLSL